jgi:hypothetical protein
MFRAYIHKRKLKRIIKTPNATVYHYHNYRVPVVKSAGLLHRLAVGAALFLLVLSGEIDYGMVRV